MHGSDVQRFRPHCFNAREVPDIKQCNPSVSGVGESHLRLLICDPSPQVYGHSFHIDQLPQFPFTKI